MSGSRRCGLGCDDFGPEDDPRSTRCAVCGGSDIGASSQERNSFLCAECGDIVRFMTGHGRVLPNGNGPPIRVPLDFEIPTCQGCSETYLTVEMGQTLAAQQAKIGKRS